MGSTPHPKHRFLLHPSESDPEFLIRRSLRQYQSTRALPATQARHEKVQQEIKELVIEEEDTVASYHLLKATIHKHHEAMRSVLNLPKYALPFLNPGRVAKVCTPEGHQGVGMILNFQKVVEKGAASTDAEGHPELAKKTFMVDILINTTEADSMGAGRKRLPTGPTEKGEVQVMQVRLSDLNGLSQVRLVVPKDVRSKENRKGVGKSIREAMKQFPQGLPMLDPVENLKIQDPSFGAAVKRVIKLEEKLKKNKLLNDERLPALYEQYERKLSLQNKAEELSKEVKECKGMILKEELKGRRRALRRLNMTSQEDVVETKGRVACELDAGDELLVTELLFAGIFNDLSPEQAVALASAFVFEEKASDEVKKVKAELEGPFRQLQEHARRVAQIFVDSKLPQDPEEYAQKFSPTMMEIVYEWCNGAKFADIMKMTEMYEGSIIRVIKRLEELLRQMASAAKTIGNSALEETFNKGIAMIKRDIVFAASLYL